MKLETIMEHKLVTSYLNENSLIIDCGACLGEFSYPLYQRFRCKFILFEPDLRNYRKIINRYKNFKIYNKAIDTEIGKNTLYLGNYNTATSMYASHRGLGNLTQEVETTTLDYELKDIKLVDILKIDIEGKEIEVIPQMNYSTLKKIKQILIEYHQQSKIDDYTEEKVSKVRKYLIDCGFDEISYYKEKENSGYDGCYINKGLFDENWSI